MTKIEWTEQTWNPIAGCSVVSPGCTHCYAMRQAHRLASNPATPHYEATTQMSRGGPVWTGKIGIAPYKVLTAPLRRRKPTTYFVNSMSDLFHPNVPEWLIDRVFCVMALRPQHRFQVLTKRPERMRAYVAKLEEREAQVAFQMMARRLGATLQDCSDVARRITALPLPNVWLGTSVEDQRRADERIPHLIATPAAVRFISAEPLLGPVDLTPYLHRVDGLAIAPLCDDCGERHEGACVGLDWVIVGGESGPGARPMHPDWARSLRDQCQAAGVAYFFKQWGAWAPQRHANASDLVDARKAVILSPDGRQTSGLMSYPPEAWLMERVGKRAAGRLLDGQAWDEVPG